jgi:hypothetical protein
MIVLIVIVSVLLTGLLVISVAFRGRIASLIRGAGLYAAGTWNMIWPVVRTTVFVALVVGFGGWMLLVVLMIALGVYANAFWSGIIISLLFPVWFVAFIMPPAIKKVWILGPIIGIVRFVSSPILIVASVFLLIGLWSPEFKDAFNERHEDGKVAAANSLRKGSAHSERNAGERGWITDDTNLYDEKNERIQSLKKGEEVYITNLRGGKPANEKREAVLPVMLKNEHGDFFNGRQGWVPASKISWDRPLEKVGKSEEMPTRGSGLGKNPIEIIFDTDVLSGTNVEKITTLEKGRYRYTLFSEQDLYDSGQCTPKFIGKKCGEIFLRVGNKSVFSPVEFVVDSTEHVFVKRNSHEGIGRRGKIKIRIEKIE